MATRTLLQTWRERPAWARSERSGWKSFAIAIGSLAAALLLALYSSAAADRGEQWLAAAAATAALAVAGWVAIAIVPRLARRTQLRWLAVHIDYRVTREGLVFFGVVVIVALAALNTGNNLLFMVLASMLAAILVSGVASQSVLSDVEVRLELPENIFAGQPVVALAELINHKQTLPSFSLRLVSEIKKKKTGSAGAKSSAILTQPIYFPYLPRRQPAQQTVELCFPRRGVYRQDALGLQTRFPFGFLEKTRAVESHLEALVYPPVEPTDEFYEILPLVSGELESFLRGRGHDLYAIRDYQNTDTARHVDWKASAKKGVLQVREFAREDERRVLLVLDPFIPEQGPEHEPERGAAVGTKVAPTAAFERGVTLCASLAWHFYEINSVLAYRCAAFETPLAPAGEIIYDILGNLARITPSSPVAGRPFLDELAEAPQIFKIILTRQARGSIPTSLWNSSYIIFLDR